MDRVVRMTWTKLLGSLAELLSSSIYICLIARTQSAVQHEHGIIIQAPDGEVFCSETVGLYCGREEGWPTLLTFSPELYLWSGMMAEIFGQQWHTETLTEDQETNTEAHQCQAEKKWPNSQWNTAVSHHLNVAGWDEAYIWPSDCWLGMDIELETMGLWGKKSWHRRAQ